MRTRSFFGLGQLWDRLLELSQLRGRTSAVSERTIRPSLGRYGLELLEDRLNPAGPNFEYKFTEAPLGSIVTLIGLNGQSATYVADQLDASGYYAIANCTGTPDPIPGVVGQAYWTVDVTVAQGWRATSVLAPVWNSNENVVYNAETFTEVLQPDILAPNCKPPLLPGTGGQSAPGNENHQTDQDTHSASGVSYYDGQPSFTEDDLSSTSMATPFGQSRGWGGGNGRDYRQGNGKGWTNQSLSTARKIGGNLWYINVSGNTSKVFKADANGWAPTFGDQSTLTTNATTGEVKLVDELGNTSIYYDKAPGITPPERVGQLKQYTDNAGIVTQVLSWTAQGQPSTVRRTNGQIVEQWQYTYGSTLTTTSLTMSVVSTRSTDGGTTFAPIESVEYGYYSTGSPHGNRNDLRSAVVRTGGLTGPVVRSSYYRYYIPNDPLGPAGSIKLAVSGADYDRLAAAYSVTIATADTLTDAQVKQYANRYYEYNTSGQATKAVVQGDGCSVCSNGQGTYNFTYARNPNRYYKEKDGSFAGEQNVWHVVTEETLPDGNFNKVYTNSGGQVMLKVYKEVATGQEWRYFTEFDGKGRVARTGDPVAVTGYDQQYNDLLNKVNGNFQYLSDTNGVVVESVYGTSTTAQASQPGDVLGYLRRIQIRRGELARLATPISSQTYYLRTANGLTIYPIASTTQYPQDRSTTPLFSDDFSSGTTNPAWSYVGTGAWTQSGGVLSQTGGTDFNINKQAHVSGQTWDTTQEILSSIRIDTWSGGNFAFAGVGVRGNSTNGRGYSLIFREAGKVELYDTFANNAPAAGQFTFNWQTGVWYRTRVRVEDETIFAKVWIAGQSEPTDWSIRFNYVAAGWSMIANGNPHLLGGAKWGSSDYMTASFDDVAVENVALPPGETTSLTYTWSVSAPLLANRIEKALPMRSTAQNGPGIPYAADTTTTVYDALGRPIWMKDAAGFLNYTQYDSATGVVIRTIFDVNSNTTADFTALPAGWTTPVGGGKHLKTVMTVDSLGRITKTVRPTGAIDYFTYNELTEEAKSYLGWTGTTTTGPVQLLRRDRVGGDVTINSQTLRYTYVESLTYAPATIPVNGSNQPTGAEAVSNIQMLSRNYFNSAGQLVWRDEYFSFSGLTYLDGNGKPVFALGTEGVHFLRTRFDFDKQGRPNRTRLPDGTIDRMVYDGQGRLVSRWRGNNDTPTTGFWSPSNPAGMIQLEAYEYDNGGVGAGNATKVTRYPGGGAADRVTVMAYDWRNRLVAMKVGWETTEAESLNRPFTYFDLDNLGRIVKTRVYDGDTVTFVDANSDGVPDAPVASRLRSQSEVFYDAQGQVYRTLVTGIDQSNGTISSNQWITNHWYDQRGLLVKTVKPGGLTYKTSYDGAGRKAIESMTDAGGDTAWADAINVTGDVVFTQKEYTYDANSNLIKTLFRDRVDGQTGTGVLGTSTMGVLARVTNQGFYYDAADRLTASVDVGTNNGTAWTRPGTVPTRSDTILVTSNTYDSAGRLFDVTDPMAYVTRNTYDLMGRRTTQVEGNGTTVARTTTWSYNSGGRVLDITAPGGAITRSGYDSFGRRSTVTEAFGLTIARLVTTGYNNLDDIISVTSPVGTYAAPSTVTTKFGFDVVGRSSSTTEAFGHALERTTTKLFDALGRTVSVTRPGSQTTTMSYDDILRRTITTDPQGFVTTQSKDLAGNLISVSDPLNHVTANAYDLRNRRVSTTDALNKVTSFKYNVTGDRDTVTDARNNVTVTVADRFGRMASQIDPFSKSTVYTYDRDDRVLTITDRLGQKRAFAYNAIHQVTSEKWYATGSSTVLQTQSFTYNSAGDRTGASDPDGSYTLTYDALHRPLTVAQPFSLTLTMSYDAASNRTQVVDNKGGTFASSYDVLNRLSSRSLDTSTGDVRVDYAYTVRDRIDTVSRFTNLAGTVSAGTSKYTYDPSDRLTGIAHRKADTTALATFTYGYDNASRLTSRNETGTLQTIGYDDRNQVTADAGTNYTYDALGNRTNAGYTTSTTGNRLTGDVTWTYTYNDEGELTKKSKGSSLETWTYGYDQRGQMVWAEQRATDGGTLQARVEYSYDAFGNRIKRVQKNGSGTITSDERYAYDGWDTAKDAPRGSENFDAYADLSSANAVTMRRVYGADFDEAVARVASAGTTAWYLTDRQGSVRRVLDNSGTITGSRDFSAFGAITVSSGAGLDRYAYTAREWDSTLNLQYTRARMYDPAVGRFLREDPLGLSAGDENLFRYVGNAHTLTSDPSGLDGKEYNPYAQHWHHQYPKEVFEKLDIKGLDINAKENGLMIFAKDHIGEGGLHPKGWNDDWKEWKLEQEKLKKPITAESAKTQLDKMMKAEKYQQALKDAKPAERSYADQLKHNDEARKAKKLADEAAEKAEKAAKRSGSRLLKNTCKKALPVVAILFWANDVEAKGPIGGSINTLADSIPGISHLKDVIEPFTGDLIPDIGATGPSGIDKIVNTVDSWNRKLYGDEAVEKHQRDFRRGAAEVQRATESIPRRLFGDDAVNQYQNNFQNGWRTIESWFR